MLINYWHLKGIENFGINAWIMNVTIYIWLDEFRDKLIPASNGMIECKNDGIFFVSEAAVLDVGPKVIKPSQPTALAASLQPYFVNTK